MTAESTASGRILAQLLQGKDAAQIHDDVHAQHASPALCSSATTQQLQHTDSNSCPNNGNAVGKAPYWRMQHYCTDCVQAIVVVGSKSLQRMI